MNADRQDVRKELRGYLKAYRICQAQAAEIARQIEKGEVLDAVKDILLQAKEDFEVHCNTVRLILGYLPKESAMYRVMALRYLQGTKMKAVAERLGYCVGHCANLEAEAIDRLSKNKAAMALMRLKS